MQKLSVHASCLVWVHPSVSSDCNILRANLENLLRGTKVHKHVSCSLLSHHAGSKSGGDHRDGAQMGANWLCVQRSRTLGGNCTIISRLSSFSSAYIHSQSNKNVSWTWWPCHLWQRKRRPGLFKPFVCKVLAHNSHYPVALWWPFVVLYKCILITAVQRWPFVEGMQSLH